MGYTSDVAIGIAFPDKEAMLGFLTSIRLLGNVIQLEELVRYKVTQCTDDVVVLHADFLGVKWYDSYNDVKCHHDLIDRARESGFAAAFIRVGEEDTDTQVEIDSSDHHDVLWELFGLRREIVSPEGGTAIDEYIKG